MMTIEELEKKMAELDELQAETENAHVKLKAQMAELEKLQAETENAHAKLIAQTAELKAQREEPPEPPHQRPEYKQGEIYFSIENNGKAYSRTWIDTGWDSERVAFGNVYRTSDAGEYAAEYYKVLGEIREWAGNWNDPYELSYDGCEVEAVRDCLGFVTCGELRFATKEDAENCIKAVGKDRLIKYYFGVRDHEIPAETE